MVATSTFELTAFQAVWESCGNDLCAIVNTNELQSCLGRFVSHLRVKKDHSVSNRLRSMEPVISEVMCHLLQLFWTHAHNQHLPVLDPSILLQAIRSRGCPDFLVLAICAASCRFSSHPVLRQSNSVASPDKCFASLARRTLHELKNHDLSHVQALCVLIQYEAATGGGKQAWVDCGNSHLPG